MAKRNQIELVIKYLCFFHQKTFLVSYQLTRLVPWQPAWWSVRDLGAWSPGNPSSQAHDSLAPWKPRLPKLPDSLPGWLGEPQTYFEKVNMKYYFDFFKMECWNSWSARNFKISFFFFRTLFILYISEVPMEREFQFLVNSSMKAKSNVKPAQELMTISLEGDVGPHPTKHLSTCLTLSMQVGLQKSMKIFIYCITVTPKGSSWDQGPIVLSAVHTHRKRQSQTWIISI